MEGFLNFIFILVLIWLGFSLFMRYIFPRLLIYWVKRKQKKMMEQMGMDPEAFKEEEKGKKEECTKELKPSGKAYAGKP